jgi:hypothetical protein
MEDNKIYDSNKQGTEFNSVYTDINGYARKLGIKLTPYQRELIAQEIDEISELKGYPIYLAPDKNENESAVYPEEILKSAFKNILDN